MFSTKFIAAAAASFSLIKSSTAVYDPSSQRNLAMYWGSGSGQYNLTYYCDQPNVDIIPIGFINIFPPQGNGLVGETFGNQCYADPIYTGPGYNGVDIPKNNQLYQQCPLLQESLYYCQQNTNKKILLSLGGQSGNYALNGIDDGVYLANFLWGAYGPYNASWTGVRPLDRGYFNNDKSMTIDFDGFDFDIEQSSPDQQIGYIACINRLRQLFAEHKSVNPCSKDYIISGAPQCPLDEPYMSTAIANAKFDVLWIQFYNNGQNGCTARNYIDSKATGAKSGFNYDAWVSKVNNGKSAGAKLYVGLLAGQAGSAGAPTDYITADNINTLVSEYHTHPQFGGVMLYEATVAENNGQFYNQVKQVLNKVAAAGTVTSSASVCKSSTSSMSSSTSTKITSTSSTSTTATSTSVSSTSSTVSSTSSKATTSSTSSSMISSSTSVPVSSTSSVVSTPPTSTPTPTIVPSVGACSYVGCYSEATSSRALSAQTYTNATLMSVEICAAFCKGFAYFGVEYGQECYCGDSFNDGSVIEPAGDCSFPCVGTPTELCGAGDRLNVYQCGSVSTSSSSVISSTSSTTAIPTSTSASLTSSSSVDSSTSTSVSSTDSSSSVVSTTSSSSSSSSTDVTSTSSSFLSSSTDISTTSSAFSSSSTNVSATSSSSTDVSTTSSSSSSSSTDITSSSSSSVISTTSASSTDSSASVPTSSSSVVSTSSSSSGTSSSVVPTSSTDSSSSSSATTTSASTSTSKSVCTRKTSLTSSSTVVSNTASITSTSISGSASFTSSITSSASTSSDTGVASTSSSSSSSSESATISGTVSSSISSSATSSGSSVVSSPSSTSYTTSTVYTTSVYTVTSCAPTVTNCPVGSVTTDTIIDYTTVCPVTATETGNGNPTTTPVPATTSPAVTSYSTSTVYKTTTYTITSCPATVTDCPSRMGSVTTEVVIDYTTVCPVTATETASVSLPGQGGKVISSATPASTSGSGKTTTTISSTATSYVTIKYVSSTSSAVMVATPSPSSVEIVYQISSVEVKPYATPSTLAPVSKIVGTGTGVPVVKGVETTTYMGVPTSVPSPTGSSFTGGASSVKGSWVVGLLAVVGMMMI